MTGPIGFLSFHFWNICTSFPIFTIVEHCPVFLFLIVDRMQLLRIDPSESRSDENLEKTIKNDLATSPETRLVVETLLLFFSFCFSQEFRLKRIS